MDDYRKIFATIWRDRAEYAGGNIEFQYMEEDCEWRLTKQEPTESKGMWHPIMKGEIGARVAYTSRILYRVRSTPRHRAEWAEN